MVVVLILETEISVARIVKIGRMKRREMITIVETQIHKNKKDMKNNSRPSSSSPLLIIAPNTWHFVGICFARQGSTIQVRATLNPNL